ncbi:2-oxo-4-hydroxy-4-carboxy-5-ureidoimidazoline decarboxylase [Krasilnikovia sp. M28-CT-15]|uniref:2-oxo-4-hydroxy-4-carboxy-5-ureidoimidazoline decarboxylase n=1 Tax=Krasilnikovia sp. M28-CT-15 TaxID=3373540 RepID=UPI0038760A7B
MAGIEVFNSLPAQDLEARLAACCAAPDWGVALAAGRPYPDRIRLLAAADAASAALTWDDVLKGLSAHPRIGERAVGDSREAQWSRREQSAAATEDEATRAALVEANRAYEERFGHVFLISASGKSPEEILAAARQRLANDPTTERAIVADELRKIAQSRLWRLLDELG